MIRILNKIVILIFFIIVTACQNTVDDLKKGLGGGKRVTTDEFLVKKKEPLTMPPKWDELPRPGQGQSIERKEEEEIIDIEQLIQSKNQQAQDSQIVNEQEGTSSVEESVLKKIKK